MQALSDDQHLATIETKVDKLETKVDKLETKVDKLETKVDDGFTDVRTEMRIELNAVRKEAHEDFRELRGEIGALHRLVIQSFAGLGLTMILGFAALLLQHHP